MTKQDAEEIFRSEILPSIREKEQEYGGGPDYPMRSEEWLNFCDSLCKDNEISGSQCDRWLHPNFCNSPSEKEARRSWVKERVLAPVRDIMES